MTDYLTTSDLVGIHKNLTGLYGGGSTIRDRGALKAALFRPQTGEYDDIIAEAAALMDYLDQATMTTHISWSAFCNNPAVRRSRLVLLTTKSDVAYTSFAFQKNDILLLGRESAGVPESVHEAVAERITIPMQATDLRQDIDRPNGTWRPPQNDRRRRAENSRRGKIARKIPARSSG